MQTQKKDFKLWVGIGVLLLSIAFLPQAAWADWKDELRSIPGRITSVGSTAIASVKDRGIRATVSDAVSWAKNSGVSYLNRGLGGITSAGGVVGKFGGTAAGALLGASFNQKPITLTDLARGLLSKAISWGTNPSPNNINLSGDLMSRPPDKMGQKNRTYGQSSRWKIFPGPRIAPDKNSPSPKKPWKRGQIEKSWKRGQIEKPWKRGPIKF